MAVLAPTSCLGLERVDDGLKSGERVAVGVVPARIEDHRGGEELGAGEFALAALDLEGVGGQAPASVEGLAENAGFVASEDRFEPKA